MQERTKERRTRARRVQDKVWPQDQMVRRVKSHTKSFRRRQNLTRKEIKITNKVLPSQKTRANQVKK